MEEAIMNTRAVAANGRVQRTRVSDAEQHEQIRQIAKAHFMTVFPEADPASLRVTLHSASGLAGVWYNISDANYRVDGLVNGRKAMTEGMLGPVSMGEPLTEARVRSFVQHIEPVRNSGAGVSVLVGG